MKRFAGPALLLPLLLQLPGLMAAAPAYSQTLLPPYPPTYAQPGSQPARGGYGQAELDQMLAPVALYPDALLAQVLMASAYPHDVAEAAQFSRRHPEFAGDDAVRAAEGWPWDPSVRSLLAFPQLLALMDQRRDWTARLGEAFLVQPEQVMDTTQFLRQRAWAAGNLQSNEVVSVVQHGQALVLESPNPQIVYVPYYDPNLIYGRWWWPRHQPVVWTAWPGFYAGPVSAARFFHGRGTGLSIRFVVGGFDWQRRQMSVINVHNHYPNVVVNAGGRRDRAGAFVRDPLQTVIAPTNAAARVDSGQRVAASALTPADSLLRARPPATAQPRRFPEPRSDLPPAPRTAAAVSAPRFPVTVPVPQIDPGRVPSREAAPHAEHQTTRVVHQHHSQSSVPVAAPPVVLPAAAIAAPRPPQIRVPTALPDPQQRPAANDGLPKPARHAGGR